MESKPHSSDSAGRPITAGRPRLLKVIGLALIAVTLIALAALLVASWRGDRVTWMTQEELGRTRQPGPFAHLKQRAKDFTAPVWRRFRSNPPLVRLKLTVLAVPPEFDASLLRDVPATARANGLRAWSLSSVQWEQMQQQAQALPRDGVLLVREFRLYSGAWALARVDTATAKPGQPAPGHLEILMRAKALQNSWSVTCGVTATDDVRAPNLDLLEVRTNYAVACRSVIPNAGALVIRTANPRTATTTNHWLILSPLAVDPFGQPVRF